jgi:hypothetical protein
MRTTYVLTFCACRASRGYYICRTPRPVRAVLPREDTISASVAVSFFFCARPLPHATLSMFPCSPRTQEPQWPCAERPRLRAPDRHIGTGAGGVCVWRWTPRCRKRPGLGSAVLRVAGDHSWLELAGKHTRRYCECGSPFPRDCAPCRTSQIRSGFFSHPSRGGATFFQPLPFGHPPALFDRLEVVWPGSSCAVPRYPLTSTANGRQQHSSSCFVCNSQYRGTKEMRMDPAAEVTSTSTKIANWTTLLTR